MEIVQIYEVMKAHPASRRLKHEDKYENGAAFVNGEYCAVEDAKIPLIDMGFLQSDATYDVATVSRGRFFRMRDHLDRFARSCERFRLKSPYDNEEMIGIFTHLLRLTGLKDGNVFWCVTRGLSKKASDRNNPDAYENRFYAIAHSYSSEATVEQRIRGLNIIISKRYIRIPPGAVDPTAKNFHWHDMKLSLFEATDRGKDWSVLTDADGYLTECPGANIFVVKNRCLFTPDSGCLEGITRESVIELAKSVGVEVRREKVHADRLKAADDAFMTSSAGGVMPVNSVDGIVLGGVEGPGELSGLFHNLYWERVWDGWKCEDVDYNV